MDEAKRMDWFAWYPVRARLIRDDRAEPACFTWNGEAGSRIMWLATVARYRNPRGWAYELRARPETLAEFAQRQW